MLQSPIDGRFGRKSRRSRTSPGPANGELLVRDDELRCSVRFGRQFRQSEFSLFLPDSRIYILMIHERHLIRSWKPRRCPSVRASQSPRYYYYVDMCDGDWHQKFGFGNVKISFQLHALLVKQKKFCLQLTTTLLPTRLSTVIWTAAIMF